VTGKVSSSPWEGTEVGQFQFIFTQSDLLAAQGCCCGDARGIPFSQRWDTSGAWELWGRATAKAVPSGGRVTASCCTGGASVRDLEARLAQLEKFYKAQK
jgi:hypothetical protein